MPRLLACAALVLFGWGTVRAGDDGFAPMFNGKDLTGWLNVNCAPETFYVKDGMIITTGLPVGYLRTTKQYENFIMEFDWFHAPKPKGSVGNSGLFVWGDPIPAVGTGYTRGIEVQVLVNLEVKNKYTSQGDLFSIWGAKCTPDRQHPMGWERCLPSENRSKGEYEWNHYRVEANNGALKLAVNGKIVSGVSACNPRKGYLALESEGSECRFKDLKIKELPSTNPKPSEIADVDKGFRSIFTGTDLRGWKASENAGDHWKASPREGILSFDGKANAERSRLSTVQSYGDFELVCDWRLSGPVGKERPADVAKLAEARMVVDPQSDGKQGGWHRYLIRRQGDRLTVHLDGKLKTEDEKLPSLRASGPIVLQHHGAAVQFRNLFVRELKHEK